MKLRHSIAAAGFVSLLLLLSTPAIARPVTAADLNGKTICWGPDRTTYLPGGKYTSNSWGDGTWQLISDGVVSIKAKTYDWTMAIEKLADGTFESNATVYNTTQFSKGRYCK